MRFSVQIPTDRVELGADVLSSDAIGEMARAAEDAGFEACFVTDHPIPGDRWLASGGHHTLDPFVALAFAAAATHRIRLQTHVLVLPYRNPFLTAKAAASLDVASGGRLVLGVAAGYLASEFAALGAPFADRNRLTDEAITTLKRAWSEEGLRLEGQGFSAGGNTALPRPLQQPHPPIWVGGNSRRAIRRAVELADGWLPFPAPASLAGHIRTAALQTLEDLDERLAYARTHAAAVGRSQPLEICFAPLGFELCGPDAVGAAELRGKLEALEERGVGWLTISLPCRSRKQFLQEVARVGHEILHAL